MSALTSKRQPTQEFIGGVELSIRSHPKLEADEIRFETMKILRSPEPLSANLSNLVGVEVSVLSLTSLRN